MRTIQAKHYRKGRIAPIRAIVLHSTEAAETGTTAENVASYFRTTGVVASAHVCVDNNSAVRCVADADTAYAAPGVNADGLQLEMAGYARQTRADWVDAYSLGVLEQAAKVTADWCKKYNIPAVRLTRDQLKAGKKGITQHVDVSAVYKQSDHWDPGPNFPWDIFLAMVKEQLGAAQPPTVEDVPAAPAWPGRYLRVTSPLMSGSDVSAWQRQMRTRGWSLTVDGVYGPKSRQACTDLQSQACLAVDGIVGPDTWRATWQPPTTGR